MKNLNEKEVLEALYNGCKIDKLYIEESLKEEILTSKLDVSYSEPFFSEKFLYPEEYNLSKDEIIKRYKNKCLNKKEYDRFLEEIEIFDIINKLDLIRYFIYLVDIMNQNKLIWGVGRGSSVSIFTFYLIGLHKVNCVKYDISYTDFFKIKEN